MKRKLSDVAQRVDLVLNQVWQGSQTRMAGDTGLSQSTISHVLRGRQEPGRRFLEAVSINPLINSTWLLTGKGEPLLTSGTEAHRRTLYVVTRLFAGHPHEHGDCLESTLEVPSPYYRPSRYWLPMEADNVLVRQESLKIAASDVVLFEPDRSGWPKSIASHPCIVRNKNRKLSLDFIVKATASRVWLSDHAAPRAQLPRSGREPRAITLPGNTKTKSKPADESLPIESLVAIGVFRMGVLGD